jgi:ubiquinone biosynthesis protein
MSFQSQVSKRSVIRRSKEIATVLLKYGIPVETLFPGIHIRLTAPKIGSSNLPLNKRLRLALQELGPTFVKFGQMMSTRPDIVSAEVASELKLLTDNVKTVDWALIEPVIKEYVNPIDETFVSLDKQPFAAASLSQAHLGSLKDGTKVVLKVQRPGIKNTVELDLYILKVITKAAKSSPELQLFNVPQAVEDFSHQMLSELDFTRDGRNADLLARNMQSIDGIRIPKIYWQYSGQRLLVMEYIKGVRIDNIEQIKKMGVDPKQIALLGFQAYWKQVFDDGFFHGDPHPGNLLVLDTGELVFLDFGLFGVVRPEKRDLLLKLVFGLVERDIDLIVDALSSFGLVVEDSWVDGFKDDIYRVLVENESKSIEPDIRLLGDLVELLKRYRLVVPTSLVLMIKVFGMVQDVCSKLYPEFILLQKAKPLMAKSFKGRIEKIAGLQQVGLSLFEKFDSLQEFPKNVNMTLKHLSKGSFILKIPDEDLSRIERISERASFRILLGLVIASIVVGMSLVLLATQSVLAAVPVQVTLFVYALAILVIILSAIQLMRSRNKH